MQERKGRMRRENRKRVKKGGRKRSKNLDSDVAGFDEANMAENTEEEIKEVKGGQQK